VAAIETHGLVIVAGSSSAGSADPEITDAAKRYHRSTKKWGRAA
jgi:hypothetical protein